jgi:diguanylate cyclase (GGDEF)-like protein
LARDKKKLKILLILLFLSSFGFSCLVLFLSYRGQIDRLEKESLERLSSTAEATLDVYGRMVEMVFDESARRPEIRELFHTARQTPYPRERELAREAIRKRPEPYFDRLAFHRICHLNLIMPDGIVFLRMSAPTLYGDNVLPASTLQAEALATRVPAMGFQAERTAGAFWYSFPLFFGSDFLGSAEFGLCPVAFAEQLQKQFPGHYSLLLRPEALQSMNPEEILRRYASSRISKGFYEDIKVLDNLDTPEGIEEKTLCELLEKTRRVLGGPVSPLSKGNDLALLLRTESGSYSVCLIPVKGRKREFPGYLLAVNRNTAADEIRELFLSFGFLMTLFFLAAAPLLHQTLRYHDRLVEEAMYDSLTGALKKGEFNAISKREVARSRRYGLPLSVVMLDLDAFKSVNDTYGHLAGDAALAAVGKSVRESIRVADCFFRWGGDEFLLVLPNTGPDGALKVAEKIRGLVKDLSPEGIRGLSVSLGIALLDDGDPDLGPALKRADEALYRAKGKGKNQVSG